MSFYNRFSFLLGYPCKLVQLLLDRGSPLVVVQIDFEVVLELVQLVQLEIAPQRHSNIVQPGQNRHIVDKPVQLVVLFVVSEGNDRDAVVQLVDEAVNRVIYNNYVLEVEILEDSEVLDVEGVPLNEGLDARVPVKSVVD